MNIYNDITYLMNIDHLKHILVFFKIDSKIINDVEHKNELK